MANKGPANKIFTVDGKIYINRTLYNTFRNQVKKDSLVKFNTFLGRLNKTLFTEAEIIKLLTLNPKCTKPEVTRVSWEERAKISSRIEAILTVLLSRFSTKEIADHTNVPRAFLYNLGNGIDKTKKATQADKADYEPLFAELHTLERKRTINNPQMKESRGSKKTGYFKGNELTASLVSINKNNPACMSWANLGASI